ncbi:MAG TPA: ATP-binding protein [Acidimicrobiia bacterium]|nr:ATP-binding protein [Acidimicrobiia bacterium]
MTEGLLVGVVLLLFLAVALGLSQIRLRRHVVTRLAAVVARLDERPGDVVAKGGNLESALGRLERTADRANTSLSDLRTISERLSAALHDLDDGVVVVDEHGSVVFRNEAADRFVGARHGEALAEEAMTELLAEALAGRQAVRDLHLFGPPRRSLAVRALPLSARDAGGAVAIIRDVSTVRNVDTVRRDFVANVSHELKTPIGALVALTEAIEGDDDAEVMRRLSRRVRHEADRLARIVDDLLDLSLIEAQEAPERSLVAVSSLVSEAVERVHATADAAGIRIEVHDIPGTAAVACDRRQVVSALTNLLDNAVKYSAIPGSEGDVVDVAVGVEGPDVVIRVRDQGIGIPERDRDRIFERFYRVDRARSRDSGGTGLGLAIVRHVAQAHGGSVSVESTEGEGSTFTLLLPAPPAGGGARGDHGQAVSA